MLISRPYQPLLGLAYLIANLIAKNRQNNSEIYRLFADATRPEAVVLLPSIDCTLALADLYEKVSFEPGQD